MQMQLSVVVRCTVEAVQIQQSFSENNNCGSSSSVSERLACI